MNRYVGLKNDQIQIVSDCPFNNSSLQVVELSEEFSNLSEKEVLTNVYYSNGRFICKDIRKPANRLRVAFVSNLWQECGIATYSNFLYENLIDKVGDYKLFIEENKNPIGPLNMIGYKAIPNDKVVACWKRGKPIYRLVKEIKDYHPDIVLIQMEYGLFPSAAIWLSLMTQLSQYRVIATMHSVFHHQDKTVLETATPEMIVHLEGAKILLQEEKQIKNKIHIVPHGCLPLKEGKLWNIYRSQHTFIQFGFGFRYKGYEQSIKATALLKSKYPDIFFTGLISFSPFNISEHQTYYKELLQLTRDLGIENNVGLITGFQSAQTLESYFRTNQVGVFPYVSNKIDEVYGASGACRTVMSYGLPCITSSIPHFSDLPTIKCDTTNHIANALDKLFSDSKFMEAQKDKQKQYIEQNSWEKVAEQYIKIFET